MPGSLVDSIGPGDRVTIVTPQGQERTGRAVMRGPCGWVLNLGGRYGTPGIASESNTVRVVKARKRTHRCDYTGCRQRVVSPGLCPAHAAEAKAYFKKG